jgi:hypothetical protein
MPQLLQMLENGTWVVPILRLNGTAHFFTLTLITYGSTEKVWPLTMSLKSTFNKNCRFNEQKCVFVHCKKVNTINNLNNDRIFVY